MMIVSKAYYVEHKSKIEIAEELGISRFRVARLLAQAEEVGVVTHTLNSGGMIEELSEAVSHHLNIPNANVLEVYGDVPSVRTAVGRAIGLYVRDIIEEGEVLGIGWGRTLNAMFDDLDEMPNVEIRLLTGRKRRRHGQLRSAAASASAGPHRRTGVTSSPLRSSSTTREPQAPCGGSPTWPPPWLDSVGSPLRWSLSE
jgi:DNA-binding transcriptional regulator LsrR (DeoR family)